MGAPKDSAGWRQLIADLEDRLQKLQANAANVRELKRGPALAAATGDRKAAASLASSNRQLAELAAELDDCHLALDGARAELLEAERAEQQAEIEARLRRFRELARTRLPIAERLEKAVQALGAAIGELQRNADEAVDLARDSAERHALYRWHRELPALLLREAERHGARLDFERVIPAGDGETVEQATGSGAATWSDAEIEAMAGGGDADRAA